jgi:TRAP-type C4-dicarboxylate transport system substrate-binding protein
MVRMWVLGALIAGTAFVGGCGGDSNKAGGEDTSDAVALTMANPDDGPFNLDEYADEVESQSGGSLRIEFEDSWRAGDVQAERKTIDDVRDGKVDLGSVGVRAYDLVGIESMQPLVAPFAVDSYALEREVLTSPLAARMLDDVEQLDLVGVALLPGEMRRPVGYATPLVSAADYRGATIGIRSSDLSAETFAALGARTSDYRLGDDLSSFDGIEASVNSLPGQGNDRSPQTLAANVSLWPRVLTIVMNEDAYDSLSDDQREALAAAGRSALDPSLEEIQNREQEAVGILCTRGEVDIRSLSPAQLKALRSATSPVAQAVADDPPNRDAMRQITAMRAQVEAEPAPACSGEEANAVTGAPTQVDGLWQMETTKAEAAALVQRSDLVPENWGKFVLAFKAGRFAFTTDNGPACIWGYGSYTVDGDRLEWRIDAGGGQSPNDALNIPGEMYDYRWSRYRDQLELAPVDGKVSPEPYRVEPWRLLDGDPSVDALSDRCPPPADALD